MYVYEYICMYMFECHYVCVYMEKLFLLSFNINTIDRHDHLSASRLLHVLVIISSWDAFTHIGPNVNHYDDVMMGAIAS